MLSIVYSAGLAGIDGFPVTVECNSQEKLPQFEIIGLPDAAVKESKDRIISAMENSSNTTAKHNSTSLYVKPSTF